MGRGPAAARAGARLWERIDSPSDLARTLTPGGAIHVATDVPAVLTLMLATLGATGCLAPIEAARPPRPIQTTFERKGLAQGATIHEAVFVRVSDRLPTTAGVT